MYIPTRLENEKFRTLILLLDGTGDTADEDATNIVLLKNMLYHSDEPDSKQKVYYMEGIGTDAITQTVKTVRLAFASSFSKHVVAPYLWLAENYREGDKVCIFGFSRGAYAARVLAGMIKGVGLLPRESANKEEVEGAYDLYDNFADLPADDEVKPPMWPLSIFSTSPKGRTAAWIDLKANFLKFKDDKKCQAVDIEFLGCWDTVNSVGYVRSIRLGFTNSNNIVRTFRHALALDEHRVKFQQNDWIDPPEVKDSARLLDDKKPTFITDAEEVWFAGCHCDIGGGSVLNGTRPNLAHISLRWMIRECFKKNTGIMFDWDQIKCLGIDPFFKGKTFTTFNARTNKSLSLPKSNKIAVIEPEGWLSYAWSWIPIGKAKKGGVLGIPDVDEADLDARDALAPAYDQLALKSIQWGIMERLPLTQEKLVKGGKWEGVREQHSYHGRTIPPPSSNGPKIKVHRSVQLRMQCTFESGDAKGQKYVPLARVGYQEKFEDKMPFEMAVDNGWIEWVV